MVYNGNDLSSTNGKAVILLSGKALRTALFTLALLISVLLLILLAVTAVLNSTSEDGDTQGRNGTGKYAVFSQTQAQETYLLRSYNGHIAVYLDKNDEIPGIETMIETDSLRAIDREKLQNGIEAATYEDVLKLLEDFGS